MLSVSDSADGGDATTPRSAGRSSLALYRRYRSATFAQVIGQEHVTEPLSTALRTGRINHAYLFSGPRGCGKTSSARILARSLNCVQGPTPTPCGVCDSCRELAPNASGSIDVIEIDAASHNGVDDARELRERAYYAPVRDRFKVYIVDEAHMVTTHAFNALLKVVEEPPEHLVFIFATTEPDKVLQTIRSRTHHYPFRLVPPGVLRSHLERICAAEGVEVEQAVFPLIVRASGGSVRDALSLLDQLLAGAGPGGVTYAGAVALLGVTDSALLDDMLDALAVGDASSVYATIERVVEAGHEPRRFATDLLDRLRDLLILSSVPDAADKGLLDVPVDALERMVDQATRIGTASAARYAEIVHTALTDMRGTTAARLLLELVCARMLLPDASADSAALLQRIERLERVRQITGGAEDPRSASAVPAGPSPADGAAQAPSVPPAVSAPADTDPASAAPTPGQIDVTAVRQIWPEVLDVVKQSSRRTRALLDSAQVASIAGTHLRLVMATPPLVGMLAHADNADVVCAALGQLLPGRWTLDVEVGASPGELPLEPAVAADDGVSDPVGDASTAPPLSSAPPAPIVSAQWPAVVTAEGMAAAQRAGNGSPAVPQETPPRARGTRAKSARGASGGSSSAADQPGPSDAHESDADVSEPDGSEPDDDGTAARHDPEAEALALLETGLGARRIPG